MLLLIFKSPVGSVTDFSPVHIENADLSIVETFVVDGNNYFKMRDLAMALSGTVRQFNVVWDEENDAILLMPGKSYSPVGGELAMSDGRTITEARLTTSKVYLNGVEVGITGFKIGNNNYFKLRDVANLLGFGVSWDNATWTIVIDTSVGYTPD